MTLNERSEYAVFTVCNLAYLPKAMVLADSLIKYDNKKLIIYLFDKKVDLDFTSIDADIFWIEDCGISNFYELAFKYDITELSTSLKPMLTIKLLEDFNKVVFLDPDTCLYNSIGPVLIDLDLHSVVLTPHRITPHPEYDIGMMRFGSFNLGFYAVKNTQQGLYFLNWWSDRCLQYGFFETQFGLSTDQKWVSIAPCFFKDLHISFDLGYNVAFWNVHERTLSVNCDGSYIVNNTDPLIFFHFSSFDEENPHYLSKRPFYEKNINRQDFISICMDYKQSLASKKNNTSSIKYGFDYMSNGDYISPTLRRAYACILEELPPNHDPFDSKGVVGHFARLNYLLEKNNTAYVSNSFGEVAGHKRKFATIYLILRILLRIIGPNKFTNLSRLMVYLSSYRQNRSLWKYTPQYSDEK
ncbi:MAG: hypothetical protein JZU65_11215 [Chlorobium sp.]|nr:hypothetical protein [Chlorobium sp.]